MTDEIDNLSVMEEREAARFAAALKAQRERPLPLVTKCIDCGQGLDECWRPYARCFYCASKRESRMNWR